MEIYISNSSPKPIYEQITDQIKAAIISGALREGTPAQHPLSGKGAAHQRHHHQAGL